MSGGSRYLLCLALLGATPARAQLPDPTRPADFELLRMVELPKELARWNLTGIKYGADRKSAILNDRIVGIGDRVGTATVVDITPGAIVLEESGARLQVSLVPAVVKVEKGDER
jgi:hypothetical protein